MRARNMTRSNAYKYPERILLVFAYLDRIILLVSFTYTSHDEFEAVFLRMRRLVGSVSRRIPRVSVLTRSDRDTKFTKILSGAFVEFPLRVDINKSHCYSHDPHPQYDAFCIQVYRAYPIGFRISSPDNRAARPTRVQLLYVVNTFAGSSANMNGN